MTELEKLELIDLQKQKAELATELARIAAREKELGVSQARTVSRSQWERMSASESSEFFRAGGRVIDG